MINITLGSIWEPNGIRSIDLDGVSTRSYVMQGPWEAHNLTGYTPSLTLNQAGMH